MLARIRYPFIARLTMGRTAGHMLLLAALASGAPADAADNRHGAGTDAAPLFSDHAVLAVTIEAPLTTLMRERPNDEYLEGKFSLIGEDGAEQTFDLKIRTRGKYRRQEKHCKFAPIRLNFRTSQLAGTLLEGQDKLKLVTHCQNNLPTYEQLVLREYLAYRFLNVLTDQSFRVRLLRINYVDTEDSRTMTRWGFVIEDDDDVALRHGMTSVKTGNISSDDLERKQQNLLHVFQYLIGNTEYSLFIAEPNEHCCHNIDLMSKTAAAPVTPLAYDFDFAGMVNAPYAQPNPRYKLRSVRQRLFKGRCKNVPLLPATFRRFTDNKDAIYGIVDELEPLSPKSRASVKRYLNGFFDHISKPKSVNARFVDKCVYVPVATQ